MQVLVKNIHGEYFKPLNVFESFWSKDCLFLGPTFSMTSLMELNDPTGLSPFLVLDAKIAFYIYQLDQSVTLLTKNLGPLGTIGAHLISGAKIFHNEDQKKMERYIKEYLLVSPVEKGGVIEQVVVYNEKKIDVNLWKKLRVGGTYLIASSKGPLELNIPGKFKAIKRAWPVGVETDYGWVFLDEEYGLENFEFAKIKKLG